MEEIRNLLSELKATVEAKEISLSGRSGIEICSIGQKDIGDPGVAVDSTVFGAAELSVTHPYTTITGEHVKKVLMGSGPKTFLIVKFMREEPVSTETIKKIKITAEKISKIIK